MEINKFDRRWRRDEEFLSPIAVCGGSSYTPR